MTYDELTVLIPSHSLEDFPTELPEGPVTSLLNAFAVLWHPALLASANVLPSWHRADSPPETVENRLVVIPTACDEWVPGGWADHARSDGAVVVEGIEDRAEMVQAALEPLRMDAAIDAELAADFLALGACYLQLELLTRNMHHFSNLDEVHLQRAAVAAAEAAIADDREAARTHLRACFEVLTEARERFYPVDCYLVDLCLLIPRLADEHLVKAVSSGKPINVLASAEDLKQIAGDNPDALSALRKGWNGGTLDVVGGELRETTSPLLTIESVLWNFLEGRAAFQDLFGQTPTTWGRRRYGLSTQLPQILSRLGFHSALHVALDDGLYPDLEQSKIRWEGSDGTVLDAMTRIPLAADSATSFLRFPARMAESMEEDHVAAVIFARWPQMNTPWLDDFKRAHDYSPVLGRFITFGDFFQHTDDPGRLSTFHAREYLTPFLIQTVARQEKNPVSRFSDHTLRRHRFDAACWYSGLARLLTGQAPRDQLDRQNERLLEQADPDAAPDATAPVDKMIDGFLSSSSRELAEVITSGGDQVGVLLLNPLSFPRRVPIDLTSFETPPPATDAVKAVQFDDNRKSAVVDLPPAGFAWIPGDGVSAAEASATSTTPMAEDGVLRNEYFEIYINETTGGVARIKGHGRSPNRLSQQLAYRFPRERSFVVGTGDDAEQVKSFYSDMRCRNLEIISAGPALGEIVTVGDLIDQKDGSKLAEYRQTTRIWRRRPVAEIDIEFDVEHMPDADPWSNYYAARFAWNDSTASLTRSVQQGAHTFQGERFESPHYLEIASDQERVTILNMGLPFHRKSGPRMVDTLLIPAGETRRRFHFVIAFDVSYPMQAALDAMVPPAVVPLDNGPPRAGASGWFFHVDARNVQIVGIRNLMAEPDESPEQQEQARNGSATTHGFALRLLETEGRHKRIRLRCFKAPRQARQRDFQGRTLSKLAVDGDVVFIDMSAYEIADVELRC